MLGSKQTERPCLHCERVRDPRNCENKQCNEWRTWFIDRWESVRKGAMQTYGSRGIPKTAISVGGVRYHHPDSIRRFLEKDPCLQCPWRENLCKEPCATKVLWLSEKEKISELEKRSHREAEEI